jgi:predicted AAA+ superfamily ATPase
MFKRDLAAVIERFATLYPIVGITGPRQSGKTTLARALFKHLPYVSLENIDIRTRAQQDPRAFLALYLSGAILDEIQYVPELLSYLQQIADESTQKGLFVITGSQNFSLGQQIAQSLSGRIGMTTLLPLSLSEIASAGSVNAQIFNGGYPALHALSMSPLDFYPSYIQTYIERDVRQLQQIENLGKFQTFLKLCAGRVGQIINFSSLAQDCGISHTTARQWLTVLEASYLVFFLQPFYQNFSKRLIKMPKLYFYDTGLACNLLGLEKIEQVETHYLKGALYENCVILELLKMRFNKALPANLYFWRDHTGHEVDCIADFAGTIKAIEIKNGATLQPDYLKALHYFGELSATAQRYLVYNGTQEGMYAGNELVPFKQIAKIMG